MLQEKREEIRRTIARRLNVEMRQNGVSIGDVIEETGFSADRIEQYLWGERGIDFAELVPICDAVGVDMLWLASPAYRATRLCLKLPHRSPSWEAAVSCKKAAALMHSDLPRARRPRLYDLEDASPTKKLKYARIVGEQLGRLRVPPVSLLHAHNIAVVPANTRGLPAVFVDLGTSCVLFLNESLPMADWNLWAARSLYHAIVRAPWELPYSPTPESVPADKFAGALLRAAGIDWEHPGQTKEAVKTRVQQKLGKILEEIRENLPRGIITLMGESS